MIDIYLMKTLYWALNSIMKAVIGNTAGGSFVDLTFHEDSEMLNRMTKETRFLHTRDFVVARPTVFVGITEKQHKKEEECSQDMTYLKM